MRRQLQIHVSYSFDTVAQRNWLHFCNAIPPLLCNPGQQTVAPQNECAAMEISS
jgi:hypothetical protein